MAQRRAPPRVFLTHRRSRPFGFTGYANIGAYDDTGNGRRAAWPRRTIACRQAIEADAGEQQHRRQRCTGSYAGEQRASQQQHRQRHTADSANADTTATAEVAEREQVDELGGAWLHSVCFNIELAVFRR